MSIQVFLSYADEDKNLLDKLLEHLNPLKREGLIDVWYDQQVTAGTEWRRVVRKYLRSADLILLLISPAFLSSDYCYSEEMAQALARHDAGDARVIPVLLRPVDWQNTPFGKLRALPSTATPVTLWSNRDKALLNIAQGIRDTVKDLMVIQEIDQEARKDGKFGEGRYKLDIFRKERKSEAIAGVLAIHQQDMPVRKYILVSYAQEDEDITRENVSLLKDYHGLNRDIKWIYQTDLKSDRRMRSVIRHAFAILLVISPHSRSSVLVEKAIQIGRAHECPIRLMWVAGGTWEECLLPSAINLKPLDCRPEQGSHSSIFSVLPVVDSLSQTVADRSPYHIPLSASSRFWSLPGYAVIKFGNFGQSDIAVRYDLYPSFRLLLDDIYIKYLKDRYDPFTYGEKWLLVIHTDFAGWDDIMPIVLPWSWLLHSDEDERDMALRDFSAPPERFGIQTDTQWEVIESLPNSHSLFGIATNSDLVAWILTSDHAIKNRYSLAVYLSRVLKTQQRMQVTMRDRYDRQKKELTIRAVSPKEVNPDAYKFLFITAVPRLNDADHEKSAFIID